MSNSVKVRFAPSPTGYLHIGGARTALFNWLYARNKGGSFILRIEDTDTSRSTDEFINAIIEGMNWLGLDWDEGPFRQTDRFDIYRKYTEKLLNEGKAYRCYCTPEELEERRKEAQKRGLPPSYDRRCRNLKEPLSTGVEPSIRFKMPLDGTIHVADLIKGKISFENSQLDDLIIMRSNGTPTYNFVVVVDDVDMGITHVIRGDDHLNNTPKQLHIYRALGYEPPVFGHLPMILGADKTRLSKRHGATSVIAYREDGYLPDALANYLVRLGWSHGDQEVFSREELIKFFSFENVGKSAAVFNPEKLLWLNSEYMKITPVEKLCELVNPFLVQNGTITEQTILDIPWLSKAIKILIERSKTLIELADMLSIYIKDDIDFDPKARDKFLNEKSLPFLQAVENDLSLLSDFKSAGLEALFKSLMERLGVKLGALAQPVRVSITGKTESPGIFEVLEVLGKEKSIKRLKKAIELAKETRA